MSSQRSPPTRPSARGLCGPKTGRETEDRDWLLFRLLQLKLGQEGCGEKAEPIFLISTCIVTVLTEMSTGIRGARICHVFTCVVYSRPMTSFNARLGDHT